MWFPFNNPHRTVRRFAFLPTVVSSYDNSFHKIWIWWDWYEKWDQSTFDGWKTCRRSLNPKLTLDNTR